MILKHGDTHKHRLKKAFKKDQAMPLNYDYDKGPRWIMLWVCIVKGCSHKEAFDITHDEPSQRSMKEK